LKNGKKVCYLLLPLNINENIKIVMKIATRRKILGEAYYKLKKRLDNIEEFLDRDYQLRVEREKIIDRQRKNDNV